MRRGSSVGRWAAVSAGALALAGAAWWLGRREEPEAARPERAETVSGTRAEVETGDVVLRNELEVPLQPAPEPQPVEPVELPVPEVALWRTLEGEPPPWPGAVEGFVTQKKRVRLEREALSAVEVGTHIVFELPDGTRQVALVEQLLVHDNGDRTWTGHLAQGGLEFPVVYTQGEPWTFATLVTPQGLFALEAQGDEGVLFKDGREAMQRDHDGCALLPD